MLDQVLELFDITPDYDLNIMKPEQDLFDVTCNVLNGMKKVLTIDRPDIVLVHGDTTTSIAAALAAFYLQIPVGHVEAGLRSFNRAMPEEINRVVTDHVSELLFAPTRTAVQNLHDENRPSSTIQLSGDIMFDAALHACQQVDHEQILLQHELQPKKYTLATLHRAENTDTPERLLTWLEGLDDAGKTGPLLLPLHPRTKQRMADFGKSQEDYSNIRFIEPIGYETMSALTKNARLVVTDSGGLQKEAYFHKTPCLILRTETEWVELTQNGWSLLVNCSPEDFKNALASHTAPSVEDKSESFGQGKTAQFICSKIIDYLK